MRKPHARNAASRAPGKNAFRAKRFRTFFRSRRQKCTDASSHVAVEKRSAPRDREREPGPHPIDDRQCPRVARPRVETGRRGPVVVPQWYTPPAPSLLELHEPRLLGGRAA